MKQLQTCPVAHWMPTTCLSHAACWGQCSTLCVTPFYKRMAFAVLEPDVSFHCTCRRPRSPGPRPRSPLSGLSRMTARVANSSGPARVTSSSGYDQARPTTANRTAMASNIYMQHHKSSRGRSRLMHHHQRHMRQQNCSIKIEVSYSALPADQPPAVQTSCGPSHTSSSDDMLTVKQIDTALENMHDSVPRVAAYADQPITGLAGGSAVDYAEPGLGMTLSEYMAKMHTTPVACNSVSGTIGCS